MNPPNVYEVARPNPQRTIRTTASVHSMIAPSFMRYTGAGAIEFCKHVYRKYTADAVAESAAAVSYYFLFSFFPFLLFVTALIAYPNSRTKVLSQTRSTGLGRKRAPASRAALTVLSSV